MAMSTLVKLSPLFFTTSVLATHVPYTDFIENTAKPVDMAFNDTPTTLNVQTDTTNLSVFQLSIPQAATLEATDNSFIHTTHHSQNLAIKSPSQLTTSDPSTKIEDLESLIQNSLALNDYETMHTIVPIYQSYVENEDILLQQAKAFLANRPTKSQDHHNVIIVHSRRTFFPANSKQAIALPQPENQLNLQQLENLLTNSLALEDVETIQSVLPNYKQFSLADQNLVNRTEDFLVQQKFLQPLQQQYQAIPQQHDIESFLANSIALKDGMAIEAVLPDYETKSNQNTPLITQAKKIIQPSKTKTLLAKTNLKNQPNPIQATDTQLQESLDTLAMWVDTGEITQKVPTDQPVNYAHVDDQSMPVLVASDTKNYFQTICHADEYVHPVSLGVPYRHDIFAQHTHPTSSTFATKLTDTQDYQGIGYLLSLVNLSTLKYTLHQDSPKADILSWYQDDPHIFGQTSALIRHLLQQNQT